MESFEFKSDPFLEEETEEQVVKEIEFPSEINDKNNFLLCYIPLFLILIPDIVLFYTCSMI